MKAYSEDLRLRVIAAVDGGMPRSEAARVFGVGRATVKRSLQLRRETVGLVPRLRRGPPAIKTAALAAAPDATLMEHCAWYEQVSGVRGSDATMSRVIAKHLGWTRKNAQGLGDSRP